jgi:hypothetical protein
MKNLLKTNKTVRDLQLQGEKLRTIRNTRRTKHSHSNTKHFQYFFTVYHLIMMSRFTGVIRIVEKSGNYYFLDNPVIRMILLICKNIETGENAVTRKTTSLLHSRV